MTTVRQVRSLNGSDKPQRETMRSLGLRRIGHEVEVKGDDPAVKGMLHRVRHLVEVRDDG